MTSMAAGERPHRLSAADVVARAEEVLGLTEEAWRALRKTSRSTIQYACLEKIGQDMLVAKERARKYRAEGHEATAYRCPFSPVRDHWHVGHVPSIESIVRLQDAVRDLHGNLPYPNRSHLPNPTTRKIVQSG